MATDREPPSLTTHTSIATPLERAQFQRISSSTEITDYLRALADSSADAHCEIWGYTAHGQPLTALRCSATRTDKIGSRLRVMLVGTQHGGAEPAGGEGLLIIARQLLHGDLRPLLEHMDIVILANANPEGRDAGTSKNANDINLNRDYVLLSQRESRALDAALLHFQPHVVLDAHESAALKRKTLGREGYMTEFDVQFDTANNPAIPEKIKAFCEQRLLKSLIAGINEFDLHAQRYIREITSTTQPLTHGNVTLQVFRNKAGVCGACSFLLETRMDPRDGNYTSFRNIRVRTDKQVACIREFLHVINNEKKEIVALCEAWWSNRLGDAIVINADFVEHPAEPVTRLPLRRVDTQERVEIEFNNHRHIRLHEPMKTPCAYYITDHIGHMAHVLRRHGIQAETISQRRHVEVLQQRFLQWGDNTNTDFLIEEDVIELSLETGSLYISLQQPRGLLLPLLLEPRSMSSLFRYPYYRNLCEADRPFFIYRGYSRQ